ncbi:MULTISPECIES: deaminase domain-containing protein [unclassified Paraflavitalea]|uniref:deaminase domain-containing protein n=1 Tax=unclassified Paraflavitalea TaxID=2798305 RepID=UPI003D3559A4
MLMPNRSYTAGSQFRYGFNGKENDNDVKGTGNQQDYGMRIYDVRLGRFLSVDPITSDYPSLTPYQFASNTPIWATDLDGLEANFSNAKVQRVEYTDYKQGTLINILGNGKEFGANAGVSAWNGLVDLSETGVNMFSGKGRDKIMRETVEPAVNAFIQFQMMSPDQQLTLFKQLASDPRTWENIVGNFAIGGIFKALPKINVPNFLKTAVSPFTRLSESFKLGSASTKINFFRDVLGVKKTQNIAILEGQIGNTKIFDIGVSGENAIGTVGMPSKRFFKTKVVKGFNRAFDSEVKLLENFAELNQNNKQISGTLRLISERIICDSCDDVISQFQKMFPNIKVEIVHGIKK